METKAELIIVEWRLAMQEKNYKDLKTLKLSADEILEKSNIDFNKHIYTVCLKILLAEYVSTNDWDADQVFKYLKDWISGEPELSVREKISAYLTLADAFLYVDAKYTENIITKKIFALNLELNKAPTSFIENGDSSDMRLWLLTQLTLGIAYDMQHQWKKAKGIYDSILGLRSTIQEHFRTDLDDLFRINEERLGRVYYSSCRLGLAEEIFNRTLGIKQSLPNGESSRDTVHTLFELGVVYKIKGDYERAYSLLKGAYSNIVPKYSSADLGTVHVLYELGRICFYRAKHESDASQRQYIKESLECFIEALRQLSELNAKYIVSLSSVYPILSDEATPGQKSHLNLPDSRFHMLAQFMAWNYHGLAELGFLEMSKQSTDIKASEKFTEIDGYLQKALLIQERVYTAYHDGENVGDMDTAITLTSLAQLWMEREPDRAKAYLEQSLAIQSRDYSDESPHTHFAKTLHIMGKYILLHQNDLAESEQCFNRALEMYRRIYGEHSRHSDVVEVENELEKLVEKKNLESIRIMMMNQSTEILPPSPSPYEYALLSDSSYSDILPQEGTKLYRSGWVLLESILADSGYCGSLWKNDEQRQIVIAHRGSQNATSWVTDLESIIQLKPGTFIKQAIELLQHRLVQEYRGRGYRISTTGHSLGGFLAQICVYWAQRSEFTETYYPNMSAVVFDAPGVVDFLKVIEPNLEREKDRVNIRHLNIHNFCAMPTFASTYGIQTGTIWHVPGIPSSGITMDFFNGHKMEYILAGFDQETGQPSRFRVMRDWPQADYSAFGGIDALIERAATEAIKLPLQLLNGLYKTVREKLGYSRQSTWYDQVFVGKDQVTCFLRETCKSRFPDMCDFDFSTQLNVALQHYIGLVEDVSKDHMNIHHFDKEVQILLLELDAYGAYNESLKTALQAQYGGDSILLASFEVITTGQIKEIKLKRGVSGTVFDFQLALQALLNKAGIFSMKRFLETERKKLQEWIANIEIELDDLKAGSKTALKRQEEIVTLRDDLEKINRQLSLVMESNSHHAPRPGRKVVLHSTEVNAKGARAIHVSSAKDYEERRHTERSQLLQENPGITRYYEGSMIINAEDADSLHINAEAKVDPSVSQLITSFARDRYTTPDAKGTQSVSATYGANVPNREIGGSYFSKK